jgi:hypothetical protein
MNHGISWFAPLAAHFLHAAESYVDKRLLITRL